MQMASLYSELAAKQVKAKVQYEYDSDEETEGGTWEHKARLQEMSTTRDAADRLNTEGQGKHHIGDFLPPEELTKFLSRYKVKCPPVHLRPPPHTSLTAWLCLIV